MNVAEPAQRRYQTHAEEEAGMSDSMRKLVRLALPADLTGQRVLDIGCNEGFFCNEAARRGAADVIGIDESRAFLDVAERLYSAPNVRFIHQPWDTLPDGPFDLVLWTSAMHYERDPAEVIQRIRKILAPDGLFVLECGVLDWREKQMVPVSRHSDYRWYPTWPLLEMMLSDFSVRRVSQAEYVEGDPVPRAVFHCRPRKPMVVLIRGETGVGKTFLASSIEQAATKVVSLDGMVSRIAVGAFHHTAVQRFISEQYDDKNLGTIYYGIDEVGLTHEYAKLLAEGIAPSDRLVIIEGLITEAQAAALALELADTAFVWDVQKRS